MKHPESLVFLQDDVVMGTLTVHEDLRFSAALRLPKSIRQREKDEKIEKTHSGAGIEQSGRFTGNKPNTPSSD